MHSFSVVRSSRSSRLVSIDESGRFDRSMGSIRSIDGVEGLRLRVFVVDRSMRLFLCLSSSMRHLRTSAYQLVPARTSWSILFTHTIGAFGHSAGTVPVRTSSYQEIPGTRFKAPLVIDRSIGRSVDTIDRWIPFFVFDRCVTHTHTHTHTPIETIDTTDRDDRPIRPIPYDRSIRPIRIQPSSFVARSIESNPNPNRIESNVVVVVLARVASRWRSPTRVLLLVLVVVDRRRGRRGGDLARVRRARGERRARVLATRARRRGRVARERGRGFHAVEA